MKKKFYGALLLGSLFLAGGMVSCSDYDDDINSLTQRVDALEKTVAELQKAIEAGAVITNVQSTENGVTVTLSDGKTFEVKNGTNGTPGSVVTIDEEGYWCIDGKRQTDKEGNPIKAQGEKGDPGNPGNPGTPGSDGKDGCWYFPDKDGFWHKQYYNEEGEIVDEATDIAWTPSPEESVRVVYDPVNGCLQISNAEDMEEDQVIYIPITSNLKSLAVIPYVLDKETNYPLVFFYNIMGYETTAVPGSVDLVFAASTDAKAHYRLNPANANTQDWDWTMIDRIVTRAAGDKNELLSIKSTERVDDEFIVTLKSNKSLADLTNAGYVDFKQHAIAALQGTNKETAEVMTSDYVKVSSKDLTEFSIITGYDLATETVFELPVAGTQDLLSYENREADIRMLYNESLDLNSLVKTWAKQVERIVNIPALVDDMVDEGELVYQFSLPKEYNLGDNETNQQKFVTLENGVLKVNTKDWPNGTGAIGTTPIVEIVATVNGKIIATGVLKVAIVEKDAVEKPAYVVTVDRVNKEYSDLVADEVVAKFTWEDMRQVYDALKITREEFIAKYEYKDLEKVDDNGVTLKNKADQAVGTETDVVEMTIDPEVVASNAEGVIKITYKLKNDADKYTYAPIVIEFPYTISHKHESFPEFNEYFVNKDTKVAEIRGTMNNKVWSMSTELAEHFLLEGYELENNHENLYAVLPRDAHAGAKLSTKAATNVDSPYNLAKQVLTFNEPIVGEYVDIPVEVIAEKANGELTCVMSYTVRFLNHFEITAVTIPSLTENANGTPVEGKVTYTIKERFGDKRALVTNSVVNEKVAKEYGLEGSDFTAKYTEGENWATKFGQNINKGDKLTLTDNANGTATIKWDNAGSALTKNAETTLNLDVTIDGISVVSKTGNSVVVKKVQ